MSILDKVLAALGLGSSEERGGGEPTVTVEHDPDASDEAAVKGVEPGTASDDAAAGDVTIEGDATDEATPDEATTDASGSLDAGERPDADIEGGAYRDVSGDASTEESTDEPAAPEEPAERDEPVESDASHPYADAPGAEESPESVKGIGPAYADRLEEIGVGSVGDLAAADADGIADRTDLSATRVGRWIERARARLD